MAQKNRVVARKENTGEVRRKRGSFIVGCFGHTGVRGNKEAEEHVSTLEPSLGERNSDGKGRVGRGRAREHRTGELGPLSQGL